MHGCDEYTASKNIENNNQFYEEIMGRFKIAIYISTISMLSVTKCEYAYFLFLMKLEL